MTGFRVVPELKVVLPVDLYQDGSFKRRGKLIVTDRYIEYYRRNNKTGHPTMRKTLPAFCKFLEKHFPE